MLRMHVVCPFLGLNIGLPSPLCHLMTSRKEIATFLDMFKNNFQDSKMLTGNIIFSIFQKIRIVDRRA